MGNPFNLKINTNNNYNYNYNISNRLRCYKDIKGMIPKNHIDIGPGVCPNDLDHHVHIVLHEGTNVPILYKCSVCRYNQRIERRNTYS